MSEIARRKWRDPSYRRKVIEGMTGLKRSEEFRHRQSVKTKESYDKCIGLREKRGELFSQCWKDGRNHFHVNAAQRSAEEREMVERLNQLGKYDISLDAVQLSDGSWVSPDAIIDGRIVIEFYGDYFHANPKIHRADEYISKKRMTAMEVWNADKGRERRIRASGYGFVSVWQSEYRADKEATLKRLEKRIDALLACLKG